MTRKTFKKALSFALVIALTLTLSACKSDDYNTDAPYGTISGNYATNDGHTLTNIQLYDMLRPGGYSTFYTMLEEIVLENYFDEDNNKTINYLDINYNDDYEDMQQIIIETVFGLEDLDEVNEMTDSDFNDTIEQIVDTLYLSNIVVTTEDFARSSEKLIYPAAVFEYFKLSLAKENFAYDRLTAIVDLEEIDSYYIDEDTEKVTSEKIDNPYYISEDDVETYYDNNYRHGRDYNAIIVGFNTLAQYNAAVEGLSFTNAEADFISLYNNAYPYKTQLTTSNLDSKTIINSDKLASFNSSLTTFIGNMEEGQYTTTYKEFGGKYYMVYKISDTTSDKWEDLTEEEQGVLYDEVYEDLFDSKLTSTFISYQLYEIINLAVMNNNIAINDPVFGLIFDSNFSDFTYDLEELSDKTNVATIKYNNTTYKITADDLYENLAEQFGVATSLNYFINYEIAKSSLINNLDDDNEENAQELFDAEIEKFENNSYASQGITNVFTQEQFLSMMFGYSTEKDVINYYYMAQEAITYFAEDYSDFYFELLELTGKNNYTNYFSLDIEHVLLYVDYDLDGNLDNPEDFVRQLSEEDNGTAKVEAFEKTIIEIYSTVYDEATTLSGSISDNLQTIVRMYNNNSALASTGGTTSWADVKSSNGWDFNIQIKVESLGTVDNSSATSYVTEFSDHVEAMYRDLYDYVVENELSNTDEDSSTYIKDLIKSLETYLEDEHFEEITTSTEFDELCMSQFGFHMLLSVGGDGPSNARFTASDDSPADDDDDYNRYQNVVVTYNDEEYTLSGYTDNAWPSVEQLKIYVYESNSDDGVENLKTDTETIINQFYSTFTSRYNDATFQTYLFYVMFDMNVEFNHSTVTVNSSDLIATWFNISQKQLDNYTDSSSTSTHTYAGWWEFVKQYDFS